MSSLTFDGVALTGPIKCEDLSVLRGAMFRGESRLLPGAPGRRFLQKRLDELAETLTWRVSGLTTPANVVNSDPVLGVEENLEYYRALFTSADALDPTGVAVSLSFGGDTFTGTAQVGDYAQQRTGPMSAVILTRLVIATGVLT